MSRLPPKVTPGQRASIATASQVKVHLQEIEQVEAERAAKSARDRARYFAQKQSEKIWWDRYGHLLAWFGLLIMSAIALFGVFSLCMSLVSGVIPDLSRFNTRPVAKFVEPGRYWVSFIYYGATTAVPAYLAWGIFRLGRFTRRGSR